MHRYEEPSGESEDIYSGLAYYHNLAKDLEAERDKALYHDNLTHLPNRNWLMTELDRQSRTQPGQFSLLFVDLDGLKRINDSQGHQAGNKLLMKTAGVLQESLRTDDSDQTSYALAHAATRLAGDEFVLLINEVGNQSTLSKISDRISSALTVHGIGASIGGRPHRPGESASQLLDAVDKLMYQQKQRRKREQLAAQPIGRRLLYKAGILLQRRSGIASDR